MKKALGIVFAVVLIIALGGCKESPPKSQGIKNPSPSSKSNRPSSTNKKAKPKTPQAVEPAQPAKDETSSSNEDTKTTGSDAGPVWSESRRIEVTSPTPGSKITSGTLVSGMAQVFEATINFRLKGRNGTVLAFGYAQAKEGGVLSPFSFRLRFDQTKVLPGDTGVLEVFDFSAKDGAEIDKVSIPVHFY